MAVAFTRAAARAGTRIPLIWINWTDSGGTAHRWSDRPIDPSVGDANAKTRRVVEWGTITNQLSDEDGRLAGNALRVVVDDADRLMRTKIATEATRYVEGQPVDLYTTTFESRAAGDAPLRLFRGRWLTPRLKSGRRAELTAEDYVTHLSDPSIMTRDIPKRRLAFNAANRTAGFAEPIIYGDVGSTGLPTRGAIRPIYIADSVIGVEPVRILMVAGHACKAIPAVYYKGEVIPGSYFGTEIWAPGFTGWPYGTSYIDYAGRRYTAIAVKTAAISPDDLHWITCDVQGVETNGDGSGTLIDQYFPAYLHFLKNFALGDYQTGAWLAAPTWSDGSPMLDETSFTDAQNVTIARMGDATGYRVRAVIGADGTAAALQDWLKHWNVSGDCRVSMWDGKYGVMVPDRRVGDSIAITTEISEDDDLIDAPPEFEPDNSDFLTHADIGALPHYALHVVEENEYRLASPSIATTLYEVATTGKPYPAVKRVERHYWMSQLDSARNAMREWAWRKRHPAMRGSIQIALPGVHLKPGTYINVRHREGSTAVVVEPCIVEAQAIELGACQTTLRVLKHHTGAMSDPITLTSGTLAAVNTTPVAGSGGTLPQPTYIGVRSADIRDLGGDLTTSGVLSAVAVAVPNRRRVVVTVADVAGRTARLARVEARTDDAGTTATPEIWNVTDPNPANHVLFKAGTATASTTPAEQTIDLYTELGSIIGSVKLELRVKGSNATNPVYAQGMLELTGG